MENLVDNFTVLQFLTPNLDYVFVGRGTYWEIAYEPRNHSLGTRDLT